MSGPWIHLFGIYRPRLQELFRHLNVDSFDSASYFRKAWLRSDQNYLASNGQWYAALRVPMTSDGRTRNRLQMMDVDIGELQILEREVLRLLSQYDNDRVTVSEVLEAVLHYDSYLPRSSETESMRAKYKRTLVDRPWRSCNCNFCENLGIHMLIFRGANRNKRRGAHKHTHAVWRPYSGYATVISVDGLFELLDRHLGPSLRDEPYNGSNFPRAFQYSRRQRSENL